MFICFSVVGFFWFVYSLKFHTYVCLLCMCPFGSRVANFTIYGEESLFTNIVDKRPTSVLFSLLLKCFPVLMARPYKTLVKFQQPLCFQKTPFLIDQPVFAYCTHKKIISIVDICSNDTIKDKENTDKMFQNQNSEREIKILNI